MLVPSLVLALALDPSLVPSLVLALVLTWHSSDWPCSVIVVAWIAGAVAVVVVVVVADVVAWSGM